MGVVLLSSLLSVQLSLHYVVPYGPVELSGAPSGKYCCVFCPVMFHRIPSQ